jgi:nitrogenase molybdenum-cofactor synthesis protein NifE
MYTSAKLTEQIAGSATLVIGPAECTFYIHGHEVAGAGEGGVGDARGGSNGRGGGVVGLTMDWHDVTFGYKEKLTRTLWAMKESHRPEGIFIITTCVPEITNEDVDGAAADFSEQSGIPVGVIHTDHFKQGSEKTGLQNAWAACAAFMEDVQPSQVGDHVNILGESYEGFADSELASALREAHVRVGLAIGGCSVKELKQAPTARLNVVVNERGLLLAKRMEERFGTPWVLLKPHAFPERTMAEYEELFGKLGIAVPESVAKAYRDTLEAVAQAKPALRGKTVFVAHAGCAATEAAAFLAESGMVPAAVRLTDFSATDDGDIARILAVADPVVVGQTAGGGLEGIRESVRPDVTVDNASRNRHGAVPIGFAVTNGLVAQLGGGRLGSDEGRSRGLFGGTAATRSDAGKSSQRRGIFGGMSGRRPVSDGTDGYGGDRHEHQGGGSGGGRRRHGVERAYAESYGLRGSYEPRGRRGSGDGSGEGRRHRSESRSHFGGGSGFDLMGGYGGGRGRGTSSGHGGGSGEGRGRHGSDGGYGGYGGGRGRGTSSGHGGGMTGTLHFPSDRMNAIAAMLTVEGAVVLEYGPAGTTNFAKRKIGNGNRLFCTNITEDDVVMGDVSRLETAIKAIDRDFSPKIIFVVPSTVLTVTGADVKGVCNYMQDQVGARLLAYEGGFKDDSRDGATPKEWLDAHFGEELRSA